MTEPCHLTIDGVRLDDPARPYIIAEASANHCQSQSMATVLVQIAAQAGADAIKFQTFMAEEIAAPNIPLPKDVCTDLPADQRTLRMWFRQGGLPRAWHAGLKAVATDHGIAFLSTPFSVDAARFLVEEIGVPALKIASGDLTFTPLLAYAAQTRLPVLLSTGGATLEEITLAAMGPLQPTYSLSHLALLHCVSMYPCHETLANLRAIRTLGNAFPRRPIGWSDHTTDIEAIPALAVSQGATILEKHLALDLGDSIDAGHSLTPQNFAQYVWVARNTPAMLGDGIKQPQPEEMHDRLWARRDPSDNLRPTARARKGDWQ